MALARLRLGLIDGPRLLAIAVDAVAAGREAQALYELVALPAQAPLADVAPLFARAMAELGLPPIDEAAALERVLWEPARRIAREIVDGTRPPIAGARAIEALAEPFFFPDDLGKFAYASSLSDPSVDVEASLPSLERFVVEQARKLLERAAQK